MKATQIYVGINGATLSGFSGGPIVAVYPAPKGKDKSHLLLETGKIGVLKGARIGGVGIPRYLKENGFELAKPGNEIAAKLADYLDVQEGSDLVSTALSNVAAELQQRLAGQTCNFVPFEHDKAVRQVEIEANCRSICMRFDLVSGFNSAMVKTVYTPGSGYMDVALSDGWLVGLDVDVTKLPRMTEEKQLIEHAVFAICAGGFGTLTGAQNLVWDENPAVDALYTRGMLEIALVNGDRLQVGGTSDDLLATQYLREGVVVHSRVDSFSAMKLGSVIGDIAAVLVRVAEMDAEPVKKALKKAA